jgi:hypothetical protein
VVSSELGSSEVQTRLNGMGDEQFLDFLNRTLQALHGRQRQPQLHPICLLCVHRRHRAGVAQELVSGSSPQPQTPQRSQRVSHPTVVAPHGLGRKRTAVNIGTIDPVRPPRYRLPTITAPGAWWSAHEMPAVPRAWLADRAVRLSRFAALTRRKRASPQPQLSLGQGPKPGAGYTSTLRVAPTISRQRTTAG